MDTTVADWITAIFTVVLAGFTAALVVVTARYVTQTKNLVSETQKSREEAERAREQSTEESRLTREEMRASRDESLLARELSVLPKLAIEMQTLGEGVVVGLKLANVGQGPALEVEVMIAFEPVEGGSLQRDERPWRAKVLARDECLRFMPPRGPGGDFLQVPALGQAYKEVTVKGRMRDVLRQEHRVDERVSELADLHELTTGAMVLVEKDRVRDELRKLRKSFEEAVRKLLRTRRDSSQPVRRESLRAKLLRALGRSKAEESEFEQEKWW